MSKQPISPREAVRATVPQMIEVADNVIYGDIWERPGLSKRDRSLVVLATLISAPIGRSSFAATLDAPWTTASQEPRSPRSSLTSRSIRAGQDR